MEKSSLPTAIEPSQGRAHAVTSRKTRWPLILLAVTACLTLRFYVFEEPLLRHGADEQLSGGSCAQSKAWFPKDSVNDALQKSYEFISSGDFRNASIKRLSGAVQVKSESFDDLGAIGEDPRWDVMFDLYAYLQTTFPVIHDRLQIEKINTHGLLYTWKGTDQSLKPTLLMAHQDTVPVPLDTIPSWTHAPWSGYYDGTNIWGRGSSDCKNQLIATMETLEQLLIAGFEPRRTILLSFGFDEECSGRQGAARLAPHIQDRYGEDGIAVIIDEGATFEKVWGTLFAKPATAEKGYTDVSITVRQSGGHSSIPSDHTSIGVLSELITHIEAAQYPTKLVNENPYYEQLQCGAGYSSEFPKQLKKLLARRSKAPVTANTCKNKPDRLALAAAKLGGPEIKYLMQTSQAVDVISGGAKVNALPERVSVIVNHRINIGDTSDLVWDRLTKLAGAVAEKHNLTLHAFDADWDAPNEPLSITLRASPNSLPVAPVTPLETAFAVVQGTTRALYGEEVIVVPGIMTGNTDTRYYWNLTKHIFRFGPGYDPDGDEGLDNIHTVNEKVSVTAHINSVKWFTLFVRNMDEVEI